MRWQEVCEDPNLRDLPYKIELNEDGKIIMSPQKVYHSIFQGEIANLLRIFLNTGRAFPECAIYTDSGTKVADVVWVSDERLETIKNEIECSIAPEICIEITSTSNTKNEMDRKKDLYFDRGAKEFWLCDEQGNLKFFIPGKEIENSVIVPEFPKKIKL